MILITKSQIFLSDFDQLTQSQTVNFSEGIALPEQHTMTTKPPPEPPPINIKAIELFIYPVYEYDSKFTEKDINDKFTDVPVHSYISSNLSTSLNSSEDSNNILP